MNYLPAVPPDSIHILITNANSICICIGSTVCNLLYLDNLSLSNTTLAIEKPISKENYLTVYPNPTLNQINIKKESNKLIEFSLFNSISEILSTKYLLKENNTINFSDFPAGFYFYE